jgi:hypothetical protein
MKNLGRFKEESLQEFSESYLDFARCERPDGSTYGTGGQCRKGKETGDKEESPSDKLRKAAEEGNPATQRKLQEKAKREADTKRMYERSAARREEDEKAAKHKEYWTKETANAPDSMIMDRAVGFRRTPANRMSADQKVVQSLVEEQVKKRGLENNVKQAQAKAEKEFKAPYDKAEKRSQLPSDPEMRKKAVASREHGMLRDKMTSLKDDLQKATKEMNAWMDKTSGSPFHPDYTKAQKAEAKRQEAIKDIMKVDKAMAKLEKQL